MVCIVVLQRVMPLCYNKQSDTRHLRIIIRSAHHPGRRVSLARAHVAHLHELQVFFRRAHDCAPTPRTRLRPPTCGRKFLANIIIVGALRDRYVRILRVIKASCMSTVTSEGGLPGIRMPTWAHKTQYSADWPASTSEAALLHERRKWLPSFLPSLASCAHERP